MIQNKTNSTHVSPFPNVDLWNKGIDAVVEMGDFPSREAVVEEALQLFFQAYPQQRLEMAIQLYREEEATLARAAEIAALNSLDFQAILRARGIVIVIGEATPTEIDQGLAILRGEV
ncbi:MAG: hypothetical protein DYG89_37635 [Caldilinea sp. CFX5]|nr:hypothetical protein [Caldilinea sp. CFX5]